MANTASSRQKTIKERTRIDYAQHLGTREIWAEGKTHVFGVAEDSIDDVGTMLYHLRAAPWTRGGKATCSMSTRAIRKRKRWPSARPARHARLARGRSSRSCASMFLPGKGTHHRGGLMLWMTDDARRLPVHADLEFRYGTFSIDLTMAGNNCFKRLAR